MMKKYCGTKMIYQPAVLTFWRVDDSIIIMHEADIFFPIIYRGASLISDARRLQAKRSELRARKKIEID
jgi:hypothetical protein